MERLPDFLILDFCEWIKRSILSKSKYSNIDMWDLLFDENYDNLLMKKAEEYCNRESVNTSNAKLFLIKLQHEDGKNYSSIHTTRGVLRPAFQVVVDDDILVKNPFGLQFARV